MDLYHRLIQPRLAEIRRWSRCGGAAAAARQLGVSPATLSRERKRHPELDAALTPPEKAAGPALSDAAVETALFRRATGYREADGKPVAPDVRAAIFWLQNRRPELWSSRPAARALPVLDLPLYDEELSL